MQTQSTEYSWRKRLGTILFPVLIALIFLAFTFAAFPFREKIQFDTDEGLNLMRSMLVTLGHPLYREVSSDQPPLFNQLLALLFRFSEFDVNPARFLVLLFSTFLVWSCAQFLQLTSGRLAAIFFLPLIILTPHYLNLSTSVMIGLPSIAMAAASMLFVAIWHQTRKDRWLVLSGFMLAFSVLIKLFTGFVAPIFLAGITISEYLGRKEQGYSWGMLRPAAVWSLSFGGPAILLGLALIGPQNVWPMIFPALNAPSQEALRFESSSMNEYLQAAIPLLVLGLVGTAAAIYRRNWLMLYPLTWAVVAYLLFLFYSPVFSHHQLLITIPAAILAAAGVGEGLSSLFAVQRPADVTRLSAVLGVLAVVGFIWVCRSYAPELDQQLTRPRLSGFNLQATPGKLRLLRTMNEYADQTNWIVTDMPMYAFRIGRPVPPILATFSTKRLVTGSLTEEDILTAVREYQPEQVMMARFEIPGLEEYLEEHYTLILAVESFRLFLRNDLPVIRK